MLPLVAFVPCIYRLLSRGDVESALRAVRSGKTATALGRPKGSVTTSKRLSTAAKKETKPATAANAVTAASASATTASAAAATAATATTTTAGTAAAAAVPTAVKKKTSSGTKKVRAQTKTSKSAKTGKSSKKSKAATPPKKPAPVPVQPPPAAAVAAAPKANRSRPKTGLSNAANAAFQRAESSSEEERSFWGRAGDAASDSDSDSDADGESGWGAAATPSVFDSRSCPKSQEMGAGGTGGKRSSMEAGLAGSPRPDRRERVSVHPDFMGPREGDDWTMMRVSFSLF